MRVPRTTVSACLLTTPSHPAQRSPSSYAPTASATTTQKAKVESARRLACPRQALLETREQPAGLAEFKCQHGKSEPHREQAGTRQNQHDDAGEQESHADNEGYWPP